MKLSRKQEILRASAHLFRKQGYQGTSLKSIALAVGMEAAPSLYNHIQSKAAILEELLLGMARRFDLGMKEIKEAQINPQDKIERIIRLHLNLTIQEPDAIALIWQEWVHLSPGPKAEYLQLREKYDLNLREILQSGIDQHYFQGLEVELMLFSLLSTLRSIYAWYLRHQDYNPIELEKQLTHCLLKGIIKPQ